MHFYIGDFCNKQSINRLHFTPSRATKAIISLFGKIKPGVDLEIRIIYMIFAFGADDHPQYC